jgi:predicted Fe-Mo cluster-binding NifX family protein
MKIAIPQWEGRISPVFDVALSFLLIDIEGGREVQRQEKRLHGADTLVRIAELLRFGINIVICGAISRPIEARLVGSGVQVIGFTCGMVDDVVAAYLNGKVVERTFAMPGCRRCHQEQGERDMPRGFGMGAGRGGGGGRGKGRGSGAGRMGGPFAAGPGGFCVCPKCGEKAPHVAGQPCQQMSCPKCGEPMTRS